MKQILPVAKLARDDRFTWIREGERVQDPRRGAPQGGNYERSPRIRADEADAGERAPALMHGIFMGELQALEGAGRTCWDFEDDEAPFALKLDMARQCWDEARHVEISVKLADWMGTELGEFAESRGLYAAACNPDPALRLTAVNRGIEGLAIDVFAAMRQFADGCGDPVLAYSEDWMLADEVTHVKMGSDWLRRLTADDPERRERALEFQRMVDKVFSGFSRGERRGYARGFRKMAGFSDEEIDAAHEGLNPDEEAAARRELRAGARGEPVETSQ